MGKFWIWEDLGGSGQRCWAAWGPEGFVGDDPGWSLRLWESGCELWGMWKSGGVGRALEILSPSCLSVPYRASYHTSSPQASPD